MSDVARNIEGIRERIALAAERSGRGAGDVALIAVTKTVAIERIEEAVAAGITDIGENRVQEAEAKFAGGAPEGVTLHMIGSLQRNKAKRAAKLFQYIHSVDRPELALALEQAAGETERSEPLPVLLEINMTQEPAKSGVQPEQLPALAEALAGCRHLSPVGLMTVARLGVGEKELRETFAGLRQLLERMRRDFPGDWRHLSMGMTDDYVPAIEEGATMIRLGRAIFGQRK